MGPRGRRRAGRFTAGFLAALWIAAPLAAVLHGETERHRFCPEHGVFEDVEDQGGADRHEGEAAPGVSAADRGAASAHHVCAFAQATLADAREGDTAAARREPARPSPLRALASVDRPAIPLLRVAPKSSPPLQA